MKRSRMITIIITCALNISGCSQSYNEVENIIVTVDPNKKEEKYQVINIIDRDSIQEFMEKLNNREAELVKFYPRFSIEVNYTNKTVKFLGNANHIKDAEGHTYKLLAKEWEIFKY